MSEDFKQDGVDFLRGLLHPDPLERMTAEQALLHPFLKKGFLSAALDNTPPPVQKEVPVHSTLDRETWAATLKAIQDMPEPSDDEDDEYCTVPTN